MEYQENVFEFFTNSKTATLSLSQTKYINRIKRLKEEYPDDVEYTINKDGTMCANVPTEWLKIAPKRRMSEEVKEKHAERLRNLSLQKLAK